MAPAGGRIVLYLKSGRHHYARYVAPDDGAQLVTAGGGGAFLHPTHDLPETVTAPGEDGTAPGEDGDAPGEDGSGRYRRAAVYPSAKKSRSLRKRA